MSNVNLTIGGRSFTVACAAGEEPHVSTLGRMIDDKVSGMGDNGSQSEARMLLFGALLLADELHETRAQLESGGASPSVAPVEPLIAGDSVSPEVLDRIAGLLEKLADRLESDAAST